MPPVRAPRFLVRLLALVRRASGVVYRAIVIALLALVYVIVLPLFAIFFRLRGERAHGWRRRDDPDLATLERLRSRF